ncbi:hypothetical protein NONI108955_44495 [Nocardia ninae]
MLRDLHRGHPDAAGGGVHQQFLSLLKIGEVHQRVIGRQEGDRYASGFGERPPIGNGNQQPVVGNRDRPDGGNHAHHMVTDDEAPHVIGDADDDAGTFAADQRALVTDHSQRRHDVAEVHAGRAYGDADLTGG